MELFVIIVAAVALGYVAGRFLLALICALWN